MRPQVGLVKGNDRRRNVFEALNAVRETLIPKLGEQVLLKPNFLSSTNQLASTHVDAIWGVLDFLGSVPQPPGEVIIAEGGNEKYSGEAFENFGYTALPKESPLPVTLLDLNKETTWYQQDIFLADGSRYVVNLPQTVVDCPCTISVAVAKTHNVCVTTLAYKNMVMGTLRKVDRVKMHGYASHKARHLPGEAQVLSVNLMRVADRLTPDIGVIDGTVGLQGNGPGGTDWLDFGVTVAGADVFAVDAVMSKAMGFEPLELGWLAYAQQLGFGVADLAQIEVIGPAVETVQRAFKPHERTPQQLQWRSVKAAAHLPG